MKKYLLINLLFTFIFTQNIIETETATIEFIGLEKWTIEMVSDTMKKYANGAELNQIYCNSVLDEIGFPSATAISDFKDGKMLVTVSLVEHQYANLIQFTDTPTDTLPLNEDWIWINEYFYKYPIKFQLALATYGNFLNNDFNTIMSYMNEYSEKLKIYGIVVDTTHFKELWQGLEKYNKKSDFEKAKYIILNDANFENRLPAICILANFIHNPESYDLLFHLFRSKDEFNSSYANKVFQTMLNSPVLNLNLFNHKEHLTPLLNGTNIEHFLNIMEFIINDINRTQMETSYIIKHSNRLLLHFLRSNYFKNKTVNILQKLYGGKIKTQKEWLSYLGDRKNVK